MRRHDKFSLGRHDTFIDFICDRGHRGKHKYARTRQRRGAPERPFRSKDMLIKNFRLVVPVVTLALTLAGCDPDWVRPPQTMIIIVPTGFTGVIRIEEDRKGGLQLPNERTLELHVPSSGLLKLKDSSLLFDQSVKPPVAYRRMKFLWADGSEIPSYSTGRDLEITEHSFAQTETSFEVYVGIKKGVEKATSDRLRKQSRVVSP